MLFRDSIPEGVLENPNTSKYLDILDSLHQYKQQIISDAFRVQNSAINVNKKWLLKEMESYGVVDFPIDFPLALMYSFFLNLNTIFSCRGSKRGIELYLNALTFGTVGVNYTNFYADAQLLLLDSPISGFIVDNTESPRKFFGDSTDLINPAVALIIDIESPYFSGDFQAVITDASKTFVGGSPSSLTDKSIMGYINDHIFEQLGFSPNKTVTINYNQGVTYQHDSLLNTYFL